MATRIETYRQERPADWLRENPRMRWRCDIFPEDGSSYHGVGVTEVEALINAAFAWRRRVT